MSGQQFFATFRRLANWKCSTAVTTLSIKGVMQPCSPFASRLKSQNYQHRLAHYPRHYHHNRLYSTAASPVSATPVFESNHDRDQQSETRTEHKTKERVLLLMSGGVDSSMCAHILHNQGYDVTGLYMHNWNHDQETQDEIEPSSSPSSIHLQQRNTAYLSESTPTASSSSSLDHESKSNVAVRTAPIRPKVCTSDRDWADVQAVCSQIGIPARRLDFSRQYWNQVFEVMLQEYERGRTPNPDVSCNREIKFGELIEWCKRNGGLGKDRNSFASGSESEVGWDYLATGHYAHVERDPDSGIARLMRAKDSNKDQTYYLSTLSENVLRNVLFPLAQYDKLTVKRMALDSAASAAANNRENKDGSKNSDELSSLKNAALKKESMGICFVGQRKRFGEFLKEYLEPIPGPVRVNSLEGPVIGTHKGLFQYTVGQASGVVHKHNKWVVLRTDLPSNTLVVVDGTQNDRLFSPGLIAEEWHWIAGKPPLKLLHSLTATSKEKQLEEYPFTAQIRHRQVPQPCAIEPISDSTAFNGQEASALPVSTMEDISSAQLFRVRFKDLQRAIAPGQQLVLYDKDECLGGAVIRSSLARPEYAHEK